MSCSLELAGRSTIRDVLRSLIREFAALDTAGQGAAPDRGQAAWERRVERCRHRLQRRLTYVLMDEPAVRVQTEPDGNVMFSLAGDGLRQGRWDRVVSTVIAVKDAVASSTDEPAVGALPWSARWTELLRLRALRRGVGMDGMDVHFRVEKALDVRAPFNSWREFPFISMAHALCCPGARRPRHVDQAVCQTMGWSRSRDEGLSAEMASEMIAAALGVPFGVAAPAGRLEDALAHQAFWDDGRRHEGMIRARAVNLAEVLATAAGLKRGKVVIAIKRSLRKRNTVAELAAAANDERKVL